MKFVIPERYISEGLVTKRKHPVEDIYIYNYTPEVQFSRNWDDITLSCRGLILDSEFNIIARPPKKFFNLEEPGVVLPDESFTVTEKVDGSLLILTRYKGKLLFATRGSFESDQCLEAQKIWVSTYQQYETLIQEGYTYLFEIIYPENRIVVDYGTKRELIGLEFCNNETGKFEYISEGFGFPVVKRYTYGSIEEAVMSLNSLSWDNREGYVIKFSNGYRVKVKSAEYLRLHKIVTNLSELGVWEMLREDKDIKLENIPDEFYRWYENTKNQLTLKFYEIEKAALSFADSLKKQNFVERKDLANEVLKYPFPGLIFSIIDGKNYRDIIWKLIRP